MQICNIEKISKEFSIIREEQAHIFAFRSISLNVCKNFALSCLHSGKDAPSSKFYNMRAYFLESSTDTKIKSISTFIFSLEAPAARQTFASSFYESEEEELLKSFTEKNKVPGCYPFLFNWFEHETLVPQHPRYRDEISDSFYCLEGKFFDYRVFDIVYAEKNKRVKDIFRYRSSMGSLKKRVKRVIYRNRFFKRSYKWF